MSKFTSLESNLPTPMTEPTTELAVKSTALDTDPENLFPVAKLDFSNVEKCCTMQQQISCHDLKKLIHTEMETEEYHRKRSTIHELRAGVLFHLLHRSMGLGFSGFWSECEKEFSINRATISRKMRLAVTYAKEAGASTEQVLELAQAADLSDQSNPALQLAFDFIGDSTTTDLYRKYGLIKPPARGGMVTPVDENGKLIRNKRRTKAEIEESEFLVIAKAWIADALRIGETALGTTRDDAHVWDLCSDEDLETLRGFFSDVKEGIVVSQSRRAERRAGQGKRKH